MLLLLCIKPKARVVFGIDLQQRAGSPHNTHPILDLSSEKRLRLLFLPCCPDHRGLRVRVTVKMRSFARLAHESRTSSVSQDSCRPIAMVLDPVSRMYDTCRYWTMHLHSLIQLSPFLQTASTPRLKHTCQPSGCCQPSTAFPYGCITSLEDTLHQKARPADQL